MQSKNKTNINHANSTAKMLNKIIEGYKTRKYNIETGLKFFRGLFALVDKTNEEQEAGLEQLTEDEEVQEPKPLPKGKLASIGITLYDSTHQKELLEIDISQMAIQSNGKYGTNYTPKDATVLKGVIYWGEIPPEFKGF